MLCRAVTALSVNNIRGFRIGCGPGQWRTGWPGSAVEDSSRGGVGCVCVCVHMRMGSVDSVADKEKTKSRPAW